MASFVPLWPPSPPPRTTPAACGTYALEIEQGKSGGATITADEPPLPLRALPTKLAGRQEGRRQVLQGV